MGVLGLSVPVLVEFAGMELCGHYSAVDIMPRHHAHPLHPSATGRLKEQSLIWEIWSHGGVQTQSQCMSGESRGAKTDQRTLPPMQFHCRKVLLRHVCGLKLVS